MTTQQFAPKDAETLRTEITAELGVAYEGNEDLVDKMVARELKSEEFKASLHADKVKHLSRKEFYKNLLVDAGFDPQTGKKKPNGSESATPKLASDLSLKDIRALQDIPDEDVDEVVEYAKFKGITIAEAKKNPVIQNTLRLRAEERQTALATNTSKTARGTSGVSDDDLLDKFAANPSEMSDEEMKKAARARLNRMKGLTK